MGVRIGVIAPNPRPRTSALGLPQWEAPDLAGDLFTEATMAIKAGKTATKISKRDAVLKMLRGNKGATIRELQKATGWQPHSVRGFLSGTVKRRLGLTLNSEQGKTGGRRYSIAGR